MEDPPAPFDFCKEDREMPSTLSKNNRVLDVFERLCSGQVIRKSEEAVRFGINERSVQRDIDDIRAFLDERAISCGDTRTIKYSRQMKGFILTGYVSPLMSNSEILAVSKILLGSRAFSKQEMANILDKLVSGCVPQANIKIVSDLLANEKYHYVGVSNPIGVQEKLWNIGLAIQQHETIEIEYRRQWESKTPTIKRIVEPVAILFSEYYFYLNAYIVDAGDGNPGSRKYDYPAVFRIDRIIGLELLGRKFKMPHSSRFQEGEFRKRVQFMYPGKIITLRFLYTGSSVEAILDRIPTAKIVDDSQAGQVIEAEVYGKGILMWLLSQGNNVRIISPESLRLEVKEILKSMLDLYQD